MSNESTSVQHRLATDATLARVVDALEELPTGLQQAKDNANNAASRANAIADRVESNFLVSSNAWAMLIDILRAGVYNSDQTDSINALESEFENTNSI